QTRVFESLTDLVSFNLRVNVSIDLNNVRPAIVVVIDKAAAPCNVTVVDSDAGRECSIGEGAVSVVVVEVASVVGKIGLENIEPSVTVIVADSDSHSRLLMTILAVGTAGYNRDISAGAVVIVTAQHARLRLHGHINVRPAVVIEIVRDCGNGISRARLQDA